MNNNINDIQNTDINIEKENCFCECRKKSTPRSEEMQKSLQNRLNRMMGQLGGIKKMIDDNRYCGDILIQIGAVESALQNLGYIVLQNHIETCVKEEIINGNEDIIEETIELIKKLK